METREGWIILRCAGRSTLRLAETLAAEGFECWTPAEMKRAPRTKAERPVPIMPTFVFAKSARWGDLLERSEQPDSGFSVFRYFDRIPVVADAELAHLRQEEVRADIEANGPPFGEGDAVRVDSGVFCGLGGQVLRIKGEWTLVAFGGHTRVKISTFILKPIMASNGSNAAKAA